MNILADISALPSLPAVLSLQPPMLVTVHKIALVVTDASSDLIQIHQSPEKELEGRLIAGFDGMAEGRPVFDWDDRFLVDPIATSLEGSSGGVLYCTE